MALETGTYISDLVATNPVGATDPKGQGDDHLRLIKSTVKNTFPNVAGAVTPSHTELNHVAGVTSAIQTQLNGKAASSHNHDASAINAGTLAVARGGTGLGSYTAGNFIRASGATTLEQRTPANVLSDIGAAAASHNHDASAINAGTLADGRLSSNVPLKNAANVFTAAQQLPTAELGHASDTTLSRLSAGQLGVEGKAALQHAGAYTSGKVTVSTSAPTGGANGDVWLRV